MQERHPRPTHNPQEYLHLIYSHPGWHEAIKPNLQKIANQVFNSMELIGKLKEFQFIATNTVREYGKKRKGDNFSYSFKELYEQYHGELPGICSNMAKIILQYEAKPPKFPILYAGTARSHTYNKKQLLLLNSMMSLLLIPNQEFKETHRFPNETDFKWIFSEEACKTTSVIEYLKKEFKNLAVLGPKYESQKLTLNRFVVKPDVLAHIQKAKNNPMTLPIIGHNGESIEEYFGQVKVDFANKFIGGGSFHAGCVQEEIMFINHPEMYSSALFCEMMRENEAIQFIGYKKYFKNKGYGWDTAYDGPQEHEYEYDEQNRAKERIVAIDALHFSSKKDNYQFSSEVINREILKAYAGFNQSGTKTSKIITGNWGCGAFNGDIPLKFLIQWLACSMAGKQLVYIPFGAKKKIDHPKLNELISKMTVGEVYRLIMDQQKELQREKNVFGLFQKKIEENGGKSCNVM